MGDPGARPLEVIRTKKGGLLVRRIRGNNHTKDRPRMKTGPEMPRGDGRKEGEIAILIEKRDRQKD